MILNNSGLTPEIFSLTPKILIPSLATRAPKNWKTTPTQNPPQMLNLSLQGSLRNRQGNKNCRQKDLKLLSIKYQICFKKLF